MKLGRHDGRVPAGDLVAAIDAVALAELERTRQPGLTLGLTDSKDDLVLRTYGAADLGSGEPVTLETLFEIGSIGKTFTAVAVLQLVDEGRIDLDAPVERYLPVVRGLATRRPSGDHGRPPAVAYGRDRRGYRYEHPEAAFQVWSLRDLPTYSAPGRALPLLQRRLQGARAHAGSGLRVVRIPRSSVPGSSSPLEMSATEPAITHDDARTPGRRVRVPAR